MNLESLEQENKEYLQRLSRKKILPMIGISFLTVFILFDIFKTGISIFSILVLVTLVIAGMLLTYFTNLDKKDKLLDEFFYENHLIILENIREINQYNSFEFSKEHLSEIIRDISYRIVKLRHIHETEYTILMNLDQIYYEVIYKTVKNESETNIFQIAFKVREGRIRSPFWRVSEMSKENLPLDLMNVLYKIKKSRRKKPEKAFKILKITGEQRY